MITQWLAVGILALVMLLLVSGRVRIDLVGVVALVLVGIFGLVPTHDLFQGFSSYAAIILAEMFVLSEGLARSGATEFMASWLEKLSKKGEKPLLTALMALPPIPSTFVSDVGLMSIFLPTMVRMRQQFNISLHRLLMPLAFSIALGGLLSMIGSAGNIIGNSTLASSHYPPIPLFGITPLGFVLVLAGFFYMKWWGVQRLPSGDSGTEFFSNYQEVKNYISEVTVADTSPLIGKRLWDTDYFARHHLTVLQILRADGATVLPRSREVLRGGDQLLVQGNVRSIMELTPEDGLEIVGGDPSTLKLRNENVRVVESMVSQRSVLVNHTLREINFRAKYGPTVLAILRQGITHVRALRDTKLHVGDVLLVMGTDEAIARLQMSEDLTVFTDVERTHPHSLKRSFLAIGIFVLVLLAAAFSFLAIQVAAVVGIMVLVFSRIITLDQAYRAIDWRIITLVGGMTPLSLALTRTGVVAAVAHAMVHFIGPWGPYAILAAFFWLAALLTQVISNVAAALILAPLAISVAAHNHWSPDALIIAMVVALSAAPITPLANKVFIMAMVPGRYRYADFFRLGLPLTVIMFLLTMFMAPVLFPL